MREVEGRRVVETLTKKQEAVLDFIVLTFKAKLIQPSVREIGEHFGYISTNAVSDHLKALIRKGWLSYSSDKIISRGLTFNGKTKLKYGLFWKERNEDQ